MQTGFFREIAATVVCLPDLPSLSACIPHLSKGMVDAMPLVARSTFRPLMGLGNPHLQTILPAIARHIPPLPWSRERLELADGDFLDLDWLNPGPGRLLIVSHGLEGNSRRPYVAGLARAATRRGWSVLAWNFRGCSGELNRLPRFYHSGASEDLAAVVTHAGQTGKFEVMALAGFSLGGNLTLKYLGERHASKIPVGAGVALSTPCDLAAASAAMESLQVRPYMSRFQKDILRKWALKKASFPGLIPEINPRCQRTFRQIDDTFTAPLHGFAHAEAYWQACSANAFLPSIRVPALILNAADDPFLAPSCFPKEFARHSPWVHLEIPERGGHVGFMDRWGSRYDLWSEVRAMEFLESLCPG
jgi:predicted alpha/beta-fold hydrolase